MAVLMSHSFAQTVAEFSIKEIHSITSVNGPDHFFKKLHSLKLACTFTSLTMALHVPAALITHQTSLNDTNYPEGPFIPPVRDPDRPAITVVDKSDVHSLSIWYCHCPGAVSQDMQLFQAGLFPVSFARLKTAFTFSVLDDFLLDNLECGTSAMNYYSKIRRLTRAARQWQQCKLYKWHGFAHKDDKPNDGDLALFCPACPQLGINLDLYLVMDGNFKAEHMHAVNPSNEVSLMDGLGFMVSDERYKSHLAIARDHVQRSDCNNHRAVNQANASQQRLEATGIGGCACARHGCFVPHSMVDFQKGKRIDGEIMETLWAPLNIISPLARGMGTPHRKEVLDYQMNDCNFMKMICITKFLSRKLKEAIKSAADSKLAFQNLNETAHSDMVILWEAEETLAHENRAEDPTDFSDLDNDQNPDPDTHDTSIFQPELTVIHVPLPSNIGEVRCRELGLTNLMKEEIALREGQANDALHAIRVHLGDKALIFCNTVRLAKSQASSTRAWTRVRSVETAVNLNASIYSKCQSQLAKLPDHDLLKKYLPLKKEDLKASSAVADPNARGQRDTTLSWFWSLDVQGDTS
ncbi:hypothetical protein EDB19DRAFT_1833264 [Suillus lakei]|nr:hypothetical protein EDB19DRAFT_1833264 [Suillus lakei]